MILGKVLGSVTATEKHPAFHARKMLVIQPLDEAQKPNGKSFLAVDDTSSAGQGDTVLVLREGNGVRQVLGNPMLPIRSLVVGVVDQVDVSEGA